MFARALRLSRGLAGAAAGAAALRFASCDAAKDEGEQARRRKPPITAASVTKRGDGGILPEYKSVPRGVRCVEPPAEGFFGKEVLVLGVPVRAHETVSDAALVVAADRLSRMLRNLPEAVRERLARRGASFHVIGVGQGTSDLPEHRHMKGVDGGYTGEVGVSLDQRTRGMGGVLSSCGEENLLDLDSDPRYAGRDILTHEFAHCVMDVGLPPSLVAEIRQTWEKSVNRHGRWKRSDGATAYAGSCASEYWAELTMWYFGTHGEFVDRAKRIPHPGPGGLAEYDPDGFALLSKIYGGAHPNLAQLDATPRRLKPLTEGGKATEAAEEEDDEKLASVAEEERLVSVEFDNRGCDCAWRLYWLDSNGERKQYGEVRRKASHLQQTFPGHKWLLEAVRDETPAERPAVGPTPQRTQLTYSAPASEGEGDAPSIVTLGEDAGCRPREAAAAA